MSLGCSRDLDRADVGALAVDVRGDARRGGEAMIWQPGAPVEMSDDDRSAWSARIDAAERSRKLRESRWDEALVRYRRSKASNYDVNALLDFRHVESKKAQLFYQTPEVQLHPIDPENPDLPAIALLPYRQKVLNHYLGPEGTDIKRAIHETLFDCLAASGWLVTEIGYEVRTAKDPMSGMDVTIWGKPFQSRVSPKKLLVPEEFRSTQFDRAPWLGVKGRMPKARAMRVFGLEDDVPTSTKGDEAVFTHDESAGQSSDPSVEYTTIWYRAEDCDPEIVNPELYRRLILVSGVDRVISHVNSPFQAVDEIGQLTPMSMRGNPIHVGTLRDLSDSAYIDADLVVGEQLANEINKFRTGLMRNRVARSPITVIDPEGFEPETIEKIKTGDKQVFCKPGALQSGQKLIDVAQTGQEPRDNYTAQDYAERDWEGALGTSDNQSGQLSSKRATTATEARITQTNSSARAEAEKDRLREYFIAGVRKFDCVLAWTTSEQDLTRILGMQGAQLYASMRELAGCYVYKILPDSGIHVDAAQFRAQKLDEYNLLRKDPQIQASELLMGVTRALGYDPAKMVLPQAPEQGPEPMKFSFAMKGEDLIGPQSQACVEILAQNGITVSPGAIESLIAGQAQAAALAEAEAQAQIIGDSKQGHGGSANVTEKINQHSSERTGGVNGMGIQ
jgi:hypothetical protein